MACPSIINTMKKQQNKTGEYEGTEVLEWA